jgi:hypothetical protein
VLKVDDETYYLRELYCSREFINNNGEEIACRIFLNYDKMKYIQGQMEDELAEVVAFDTGRKEVPKDQPAIPHNRAALHHLPLS